MSLSIFEKVALAAGEQHGLEAVIGLRFRGAMAKRRLAPEHLAEMCPPKVTHRQGKAIDQMKGGLGGAKVPDPVAVHALLDRPQVGRLAHKGRARAQSREPGAPVAVKVAPDLLVLTHAQVGANDFQRQRLLIAQGRGKAIPLHT